MTSSIHSRRFLLLLFTGLLVAVRLMSAGRLCAATYIPIYVNLNPGGTTKDYQWTGYTDVTRPVGVSPSTGGHASEWPAGIVATNSTPGSIFSGNPGFGADTTDFLSSGAAGGIYSFFSETHYQVVASSPEANLKTLLFQLSMAEGVSASLVSGPTLSVVTGLGTQTLSATFSTLLGHDAAVILGQPSFIDLLSYQWDLSSIAAPITSYTIDWQTSQHAITYGQDVTESTTTSHSSFLAVPEPSRAVFSLIALMGVALRRRRA